MKQILFSIRFFIPRHTLEGWRIISTQNICLIKKKAEDACKQFSAFLIQKIGNETRQYWATNSYTKKHTGELCEKARDISELFQEVRDILGLSMC